MKTPDMYHHQRIFAAILLHKFMELTFQGKTQSAFSWGKEIGMSYHTILTRMALGWVPEEILTIKPKKRVVRKITYQGRTQTIYAWSKQLGIYPGTISYRLDVGMPIKEVLNPKKQKPPIKVNGKTFREWSNQLGISTSILRKRWEQGTTFDKPPSKRQNIEYKGKTQSLMQWSKELGVNYNVLYQRLRRGLPLEKTT